MSNRSAHERALAAFELDDIFIVDLRCNVPHDYNQTATSSVLRYQHRFDPRESGIIQSRKAAEGSEQILIFRYYIDGGVRLIKPEVPVDRDEFSDDDVLAEIHGTVAVDYVSSQDLREDSEAVGAFSTNVLYHAWPYWRAAVSVLASDMRLPRVVLPMLRQGRQKNARAEKVDPSR